MYEWSKMSVGILGAGIENIALIKYLLKQGAKIILYDLNDPRVVAEKMKDIEDPNLMIVAGKDYRRKLSKHDIFFRSPGMPLKLAKRLTRGKGVLSSAMQLFFELCPAKIIGVTGTKGKGTTSALVSEILKQKCKLQNAKCKNMEEVYLVGNIGKAPFEVFDQLTQDDWVVMEMSSFQLEDMTVSPHIAVVLNITPDHLAPLSKSNPNYHKNFKTYVAAKRKIVEFQTPDDFAVIGLEEKLREDFIDDMQAKIFYINNEQGCFEKDGKFYLTIDGEVKEVAEVGDLKVKGAHHRINCQAAIMAAYLAGASLEEIRNGIKAFQGLPHRLQFVAKKAGAEYFDDSYATDPDAAIAAIKSFDKPIVLICGGSSKGADFGEFAKTVKESTVKSMILIGDEAERIKDAVMVAGVDLPLIVGLQTMEEIIRTAAQQAKDGSVVLLAPACASFGLFKSATDRGEQFIKNVTALT